LLIALDLEAGVQIKNRSLALEGEQGIVLFEARQLVAVGAPGVDQGMDTLGEKDALEVVLHGRSVTIILVDRLNIIIFPNL